MVIEIHDIGYRIVGAGVFGAAPIRKKQRQPNNGQADCDDLIFL